MAGAGSTTEGKVNGIDIYGWTTPVTIEKMTNIPTHNLGGQEKIPVILLFVLVELKCILTGILQ